jgi:uncharacterized surface protein with fasciclin (FAS1) repeats
MKVFKMIAVLVIALVVLAFTSNTNPEKTISETVAEKQNLSTLLTALQAADLVEALKGDGPFTVFAPTNEAFANLPEGKLNDLLKPENKAELAKILKYHVVSGKVYASELKGEQMVATLEGTEIKVSVHSPMKGEMEGEAEYANKVMVNNAEVTNADIMASNGVIHIINNVVLPSDVEVMGASEYQR